MSKQLNQPITEHGIPNTNFFNGRLLTAQDLKTDQDAERSQRWQLGQGIGEGVIEGFEVSLISPGTASTLPVVSVTKGLALNRKGQILSLPDDDQVTLIRSIDLPPPEAGVFGECGLPTSTFSNLDKGAYLLVVKPASIFREKAPMRNVEPNGSAAGCGSKYAVEGVQFELIKLDLDGMTTVSPATRTQINGMFDSTDAATISKLRNILAHICFDSEEANGQRRDPFQRLDGNPAYVSYGGLAEMRRLGELTDCEVPLALLYWNRNGVQFLDNWAARRLARRILELDVLSILRSYGYERFLQFQNHLQDLFDDLGGLATVRVQDYFQYLPPVGYFAVTGAKSPRGFHPTNFFRQYTTGQGGDITVEKFGVLLREAFACPEVDLQTNPVFQVYGVEDNARTVAASTSSSQLYQVFVSRALNGPLAQDGVAKAFSDAWEVYRSLIKRRTFLPDGLDEEKFTAQTDITLAIRNVLDMANRQAALAGAWALDTKAALAAFQDMYRVQKELTTLFRSVIPGIVHTAGREAFAAVIDRFLDVMILDGSPGLLPSIQAPNLLGAVKAQNQINNHVGTFVGGVVARGPFGFRYLDSPRGLRIVPGATRPALPHNFAVMNHTDKRLTIGIEGNATAPDGKWDGMVKIQNTAGADITDITLDSGAEGNIAVLVTAPNDAQFGETATVTLIATVPPPTDREARTTLALEVARSEGGTISTRVAFDGEVTHPGLDPNNAPASDFVSYFFNLVYSSTDGPPSAEFDFNVDLVPTPAVTGWSVEFQGVTARHTAGTTLYTRDVTLSTTGTNQVEVIIGTPSRGSLDRLATFTVNVRSKTQPTDVHAQHPDSFTLIVKAP